MSPSRRHRRHLLAVVALAAALRLYQVGAESLWIDELITLDFVARWSGLALAVQLPLHQPHLPLYYLLLDSWIPLVGLGEAALRLPSVAFGVAAVAAVYAVGRRLVDATAGLVAATLVAVSRFHVRYSQEVRMYSLLTLLTVLSMYLLVRLRDEWSGSLASVRWTAAAYATVTVLLLLTHPFAVFVVLAQVAYVAVRATAAIGLSRRWRWVAGIAPVALTCVALVVVTELLRPGVSLEYIPPPTVARLFVMLATYVGYGEGTRPLVHAVVLPPFLAAAALGFLRYRVHDQSWADTIASFDPVNLRVRVASADESLLLGGWFAVAFGLPVVLSFVVTPVFWPRYTIAASPAFFLLVARGVSHVRGRRLRVAVAALLVLSMVPALGLYYAQPQHEQWEEAAADIDARANASDLVLVADVQVVRAVHHYSDHPRENVSGIATASSASSTNRTSDAAIRKRVRGHDTVWLVFSHANESERRRVQALVGETHDRTWHRQYKGVEVLRYGREKASD